MLVVAAPAKLNLSLEVLGRRTDGFHELDSVVAPLDWHDLVGVSLEEAATTSVELRLTGPALAGVPDSADNLAVRAARGLAELAATPLRVRIWLEKRLPPAAGLGGGSADAGAVLRAGAELLARRRSPLPEEGLAELAARLGSDVPATLHPGWLRLQGRGERLERLPGPELEIVVALAGASSTPQVFAELRAAELCGDGRSQRIADRLRRGQAPDADDLGSALEAPAARASPQLGAALRRLRGLGGGVWQLTGSGGAAFAVVHDQARAEELAGLASAAGLPARACRTLGSRLP